MSHKNFTRHQHACWTLSQRVHGVLQTAQDKRYRLDEAVGRVAEDSAGLATALVELQLAAHSLALHTTQLDNAVMRLLNVEVEKEG
jgi:hypothetical protein